MNPISPIPSTIPSIEVPSVRPAATSGNFSDHLKASMKTVEGLGREAGQSVERFLNGEGEELHQAALAMQKAEISFDLFMQTRNKVVQAYQEIMRMQL